MDCSVSIRCKEGRARSPSRGGEERSKGRGEEMIALLSRVLDYTINLTTPEATVVPELGRWNGMSLRQWRKMPKVVVVPELGRWSWSRTTELGVR